MNATPPIDHALLRRYDRPVPRYTSYPTATQFQECFRAHEFRQHAAQGNAQRAARPISLYVHIPFCQSPCFYCGCNRFITRDAAKGERYVQALLKEAQLVSPLFRADRPVRQLHLGGGTPNFLKTDTLGVLMDGLRQNFMLTAGSDRDFSIELDPRSLPEDPASYAQKLAQLGFNRVSLGVQDFNEDVQRAVNRLQSVDQTLDLIDACRDVGFRSVNVDLIYGLPKQSLQEFRHTLRIVTSARPDRVAIYGYAHLPSMFKAQKHINAADLPDTEARLALLRLAIEELGESGYRYIGMDHFALPDDDLLRAQQAGTLQRNFMGYTTHAECDLIGLGVSAISGLSDCYSQNFRDLRHWERSLEAGELPIWRGLSLTRDDQLRAAVIEQLMCHGEIDIPSLEQVHEVAFREYFADALALLAPQVADGLVQCSTDRITATATGRLLLRSIANCFDRYVSRDVPVAGMAKAV